MNRKIPTILPLSFGGQFQGIPPDIPAELFGQIEKDPNCLRSNIPPTIAEKLKANKIRRAQVKPEEFEGGDP